MQRPKVTVPELRARKSQNKKISVLTAYDATLARLFDEGGVDVLLVGDSLGMVVQGLDNTLPVTLDEICYHGRAVARGARRAHVVGDLPFMSYQISVEQALSSAGQMLKCGGFEAVKLEGGEQYAEHVRRIVGAGIPVMGHIGLTPQSVHAMGGFKVQGKDKSQQEQLRHDAKALADAGAYAIVIEGVPLDLAREITATVAVPTIGIGAGPHCDGQVLVCYDFLGMYPDLRPKFVKRFAELGSAIVAATQSFATEIQSGVFPGLEHSFGAGKAAPVLAERSEPSAPSAKQVTLGYGPLEEPK